MQIKEIIRESQEFSNWRRPSEEELRQEYRVEYEIKPALRSWLDDSWPRVEDFLAAVKENSRVISVTDDLDRQIEYRSRTRNREQLRSLISSYRSWPEFRNDDTLSALYQGFEEGRSMTMPIVVEYQGDLRIMAGNTRMDVAQHLGITPRVLLIKVD